MPSMPDSRPSEPLDKDLPLREDIRLLGRVLGDTIREQDGEPTFVLVETIRQTAVRFARDARPEDRETLHRLLTDLPIDTMMSVVRSFAYFLQLANIAEDTHVIRRRRAHEIAEAPAREGSLQYAIDAVMTRASISAGQDEPQSRAAAWLARLSGDAIAR